MHKTPPQYAEPDIQKKKKIKEKKSGGLKPNIFFSNFLPMIKYTNLQLDINLL